MKGTKTLVCLLITLLTLAIPELAATSWNLFGKVGENAKAAKAGSKKSKSKGFTLGKGGNNANQSQDYEQLARQYELMARIQEASENGETLDLSDEDLDILSEINPELAATIREQREVFGSFNVSSYPFDENELEWNEYKTDKSSAQITNGALYITNRKGNDAVAFSATELPVNTEGDFIIAATVTVPKFERNHPYVMYFNMEDIRNTGALYFDSETVKYVKFTDGVAGAEQSALINGVKGRNTPVRLIIKKDEGRVTITINGDECLKIRKIDFTNSGFGFGAMPNDLIVINSVSCGNKIENDEADSNSDD